METVGARSAAMPYVSETVSRVIHSALSGHFSSAEPLQTTHKTLQSYEFKAKHGQPMYVYVGGGTGHKEMVPAQVNDHYSPTEVENDTFVGRVLVRVKDYGPHGGKGGANTSEVSFRRPLDTYRQNCGRAGIGRSFCRYPRETDPVLSPLNSMACPVSFTSTLTFANSRWISRFLVDNSWLCWNSTFRSQTDDEDLPCSSKDVSNETCLPRIYTLVERLTIKRYSRRGFS